MNTEQDLLAASPSLSGEHHTADEAELEWDSFLRWLLARLLANTIIEYCWLERNGYVSDFKPTTKARQHKDQRAKRIFADSPCICRSLQQGSSLSALIEQAFQRDPAYVQRRVQEMIDTNNWQQLEQ